MHLWIQYLHGKHTVSCQGRGDAIAKHYRNLNKVVSLLHGKFPPS